MTTRQTAFEQFAKELGYALDQEIWVGGNYRGLIRHGNTVTMLPGRMRDVVAFAQAQQAAHICVLRALQVLYR